MQVVPKRNAVIDLPSASVTGMIISSVYFFLEVTLEMVIVVFSVVMKCEMSGSNTGSMQNDGMDYLFSMLP
jgi:hypothetical protein